MGLGYQYQQQQLLYDNSAFLIFIFAWSFVIVLACSILLISRFIKWKYTNNDELSQMTLYKQKVHNYKKVNNLSKWTMTNKNIIILIVISTCLCIFCSNRQDFGHQLSGFDPYEILNLPTTASLTEIKKAYRKLALEHHPDRSNSNPSVFIKISNAYKCLTEQQSCFGPDDEISYKIGIGFPKQLLQSSLFLNIFVFLSLAIIYISPFFVLRSAQKLSRKDTNTVGFKNYSVMKTFNLQKKYDLITLCGIFGNLQTIRDSFPKQTLTENYEKSIKSILFEVYGFNEEKLSLVNSKSLLISIQLYHYFHNKNSSLEIESKIPQFVEQIFRYIFLFTRKETQIYGMRVKGKQPQKIFSLIKKLLAFSRRLFTRCQKSISLNPLFFLVDLQKQEIQNLQIYRNIDFQTIINNQQECQQFLEKLSDENAKKMKQLIDLLPHLTIRTCVMIGDKQAKKIFRDDYIHAKIQVTKNNITPGFVIGKFNYLCPEKFLLISIIDERIVSWKIFSFPKNCQKINHTFRIKRINKIGLKIKTYIFSLNYYNLDVKDVLKIKVCKRKTIKKVQIHPQDLHVQQIQKNFFEKIVNFQQNDDDQDQELSEGTDSETSEKCQQNLNFSYCEQKQKKKELIGFQQQ